MTNIEKRLHNAEAAIVALCALVSEYLPSNARGGVNALTREYFESFNSLGSNPEETMKNTGNPFLTGDDSDG